MGDLTGAAKLARSSYSSNTRKAFVFGLKILKPVGIWLFLILGLLYTHDLITGQDMFHSVVYGFLVTSLRWRTLIQLAPLVDQFTPGILRLFGLGAVLKGITGVGAIGIAYKWLRNKE